MLDFINTYGSFILLVICFIGVALYITWSLNHRGKKQTLDDFRYIAYQLMLVAEKKYSLNEDKFFYVVEEMYKYLPVPLNLIVTKAELQKWVNRVYDDFVIDFMDDGKINDSNM